MNIMSEIFAVIDLISGFFAGVIGVLLAYLFGIRQLRKGIEQQAAQAFIDTHFLLLHGALGNEWFTSSISSWLKDSLINLLDTMLDFTSRSIQNYQLNNS